jgi:hypothetical protein
MISIEGHELPEHVSYSAFTDYLSCGWMYYLNRIKNAEEIPAWWLYGGVSFHEATEVYDKETFNKGA